jgi:hypothetical protein
MTLGFDIAPFVYNFSRFVEEKGRADHTNIDLSIILFFSDNSEVFVEFTIGISDEIDAETTALAKFCMRGFTVFRYSDDVDSEGFEILLEPRKILGFEGATRSIIFRVKIEEGFFVSLGEFSNVHKK